MTAGIEAFLAADQEKDLLRFSTAGSVDDGKSTLIGRLLHDSKTLFEDHLAAVRNSRVNRAAGPIDFSLITDGLKAEREQGITIDVAYRYFATPARKFIIADTPGHEQYTRNMATGASTADLAVILIDAARGIMPQSRRHAYIAALLGIPQLVVAVNKMDLAGYSREVFEAIRDEFSAYLESLGAPGATFIPISALEGDNVVERGARMPWYTGANLLEHLETAPLPRGLAVGPLRFPVQCVARPDAAFRGYAGQIASGVVRRGDSVLALPSGRFSRVKRIVTYDGDLDEAFAPMSVTLALEDDLDISRGDMLAAPTALPHVSRRFEARLVWMHHQPLEPGRPYLLKHTSQQVTAKVRGRLERVDVGTLERTAAVSLTLNEIGVATLETNRPLFFDSYQANRATGAFILIDPMSNATVAAGMIAEREREAAEPARREWEGIEFKISRVTPAERFARSGHFPAVVWLTARREMAYLVEAKLFAAGCQVHVLAEDLESAVVVEAAELLAEAGLIAIVSSFDREERERARRRVGEERFVSIEPGELAASDESAAAAVCQALEHRGIVRALDRYTEGEGI
jgi:sulfate adenylyltransferase large subunit